MGANPAIVTAGVSIVYVAAQKAGPSQAAFKSGCWAEIAHSTPVTPFFYYLRESQTHVDLPVYSVNPQIIWFFSSLSIVFISMNYCWMFIVLLELLFNVMNW